jgi:hypothetical protein
VPLADLIDALTRFLDHFGTKALVGETFLATIGSGDGHARLARLLEACNYRDNPNGFFSELLAFWEKQTEPLPLPSTVSPCPANCSSPS